jgi:DNA transformation protein and related proteins
MFGGAGLYRDGIMFGLVSDGEIYLKADDSIVDRFRAAGSCPFVYRKGEKPVSMSYWSMPEAALDDGDLLKEWAGLSFEAAVRAKRSADR